MHRDLREQNRHSWNAVVGAHDSHRGDLARFLREGGSTLFPEERALLGDLGSKTLAHLQCSSGGDSGYGKNPKFLEGLEERKLPYVCGVESTFAVRLPDEVEAAAAAPPPTYRGRGRPPKQRPAPLYTAEDIIGSLPEQSWQQVSWRQGTKGELSKRMAAVRVHRGIGSKERYSRSHQHVSTGPGGWLIAEKKRALADEEGETKYYFSTLPAGLSIHQLGAWAHARWVIEQFYEDAKGECGLGDFQGRRWDGFHRHLALVMLAYSFLAVRSSVH